MAVTLDLGKKLRQDVADEVDQPVAKHVGNEVAAPEIESSEDSPEGESDHDIGQTAGPMADGKMTSGMTTAQNRLRPTACNRSMA